MESTDNNVLWNAVMDDPDVDEISVSFKGDRMLLRWKYPDGPNHYKWFPVDM